MVTSACDVCFVPCVDGSEDGAALQLAPDDHLTGGSDAVDLED
jgi:hypothetical protein